MKFIVGDYANLEGELVIIAGEPTEDRIPILLDGRIIYPKIELFSPLTELQKKSIKIFHLASIHGVVKELEEALRESLNKSGLGENSEE